MNLQKWATVATLPVLTCSWYMNGTQTLDIYVKNTLFIDANAWKITLKTSKRNRLKHSSKEGRLSFRFPTARSRLIWNLLCYSIVRYKQRKMQVMQMVLTVRGTSQVPVYSGWVFSWVPLSFLGSSNVSLRSQLYLQRSQSLIQLLLEGWLLAMYSMSDLTQVFKTEIELAVGSVVQRLDCSINCRFCCDARWCFTFF